MPGDTLVTVFVPVYNAEQYIRQCIDSVLAQTYHHFELLLIDDGSVDNSAAIICAYEDSRIRFYQNDRNRGIPYTRNRGLELARGKYIAFLDADDVAYPKRLELCVKFLEEHPEYRVVGGMFDYLVDGVVKKGPRQLEKCSCRNFDTLFCSPLANSTAMVDLEFVIQHNITYNMECFVAQDYDFFCQCLKYTSIARLNSKLVCYRTGHENATARSMKDRSMQRTAVIRTIRGRAFDNLGINISSDDRDRLEGLLMRESELADSEYRQILETFRQIETEIPGCLLCYWKNAVQKVLTDYIIRKSTSHMERFRLWKETDVLHQGSYRWVSLARIVIF